MGLVVNKQNHEAAMYDTNATAALCPSSPLSLLLRLGHLHRPLADRTPPRHVRQPRVETRFLCSRTPDRQQVGRRIPKEREWRIWWGENSHGRHARTTAAAAAARPRPRRSASARPAPPPSPPPPGSPASPPRLRSLSHSRSHSRPLLPQAARTARTPRSHPRRRQAAEALRPSPLPRGRAWAPRSP